MLPMFSLMWIMPSRVMTQSAGRPTVAPRGGGMGGRVGRGCRRVRDLKRRNVEPTGEPKGQGNDQGVEVNEGVDGVHDFSTIISQQWQNLLPSVLAQVSNQGSNQGNGVLSSNPKEYNGKEGAMVYTRWIEKKESVQDMSGCEVKQKVKYTAGLFVDKALTWWNSHINTLS
ncbi:hypothetical protein Tco_1580169 [Tanacetum coccineum]